MYEDVVLLVMTDGRDELLFRTLESAFAKKNLPRLQTVIHDDSGSPEHRGMLAERFPNFTVIGGPRAGFGGAIQRAWGSVPEGVNWIFHLEDDFLFNEPVRLGDMQELLVRFPYLVQVALLRQAWSEEERVAGGLVEQDYDSYEQMAARSLDDSHTIYWFEHRKFFTTNPSLYRRSLTERGWPDGAHSEGLFSVSLFEDPELRSAYFGVKDQGPLVEHIGAQRQGTDY